MQSQEQNSLPSAELLYSGSLRESQWFLFEFHLVSYSRGDLYLFIFQPQILIPMTAACVVLFLPAGAADVDIIWKQILYFLSFLL